MQGRIAEQKHTLEALGAGYRDSPAAAAGHSIAVGSTPPPRGAAAPDEAAVVAAAAVRAADARAQAAEAKRAAAESAGKEAALRQAELESRWAAEQSKMKRHQQDMEVAVGEAEQSRVATACELQREQETVRHQAAEVSRIGEVQTNTQRTVELLQAQLAQRGTQHERDMEASRQLQGLKDDQIRLLDQAESQVRQELADASATVQLMAAAADDAVGAEATLRDQVADEQRRVLELEARLQACAEAAQSAQRLQELHEADGQVIAHQTLLIEKQQQSIEESQLLVQQSEAAQTCLRDDCLRMARSVADMESQFVALRDRWAEYRVDAASEMAKLGKQLDSGLGHTALDKRLDALGSSTTEICGASASLHSELVQIQTSAGQRSIEESAASSMASMAASSIMSDSASTTRDSIAPSPRNSIASPQYLPPMTPVQAASPAASADGSLGLCSFTIDAAADKAPEEGFVSGAVMTGPSGFSFHNDAGGDAAAPQKIGDALETSDLIAFSPHKVEEASDMMAFTPDKQESAQTASHDNTLQSDDGDDSFGGFVNGTCDSSDASQLKDDSDSQATISHIPAANNDGIGSPAIASPQAAADSSGGQMSRYDSVVSMQITEQTITTQGSLSEREEIPDTPPRPDDLSVQGGSQIASPSFEISAFSSRMTATPQSASSTGIGSSLQASASGVIAASKVKFAPLAAPAAAATEAAPAPAETQDEASATAAPEATSTADSLAEMEQKLQYFHDLLKEKEGQATSYETQLKLKDEKYKKVKAKYVKQSRLQSEVNAKLLQYGFNDSGVSESGSSFGMSGSVAESAVLELGNSAASRFSVANMSCGSSIGSSFNETVEQIPFNVTVTTRTKKDKHPLSALSANKKAPKSYQKVKVSRALGGNAKRERNSRANKGRPSAAAAQSLARPRTSGRK